MRFSVKKLYSLLLILPALGVLSAHAELRNELLDNPSPYLAMHGHDPVHWQLWTPAVMQQAKRENKLVYISSGYFACHWCHVMQRESYQNPEIAALLNRNFIPVKIDRELHPALDARLIEFVQRTRGYSGWPLNVFITPEGYPLVGIVYLPPKNFKALLVKVAQRWGKDEDDLKGMARAAAEAMQPKERSAGPDLPANLAVELRASLVTTSLRAGDELAGGFGQQNKFPSAPQLLALLDALAARPDAKLAAFLRVTLDQMASQGLRDHIRGGFFRYTTDPNWQVPHFEKMLYDNALLAEVYLKAAEVLHQPHYQKVADDTFNFMLHDLTTKSGAMIASLSAVDDKNVEGGFYLWSEDDLKRLLDQHELQVVKLAWHMRGAPPLANGYLPVISMSPQAVGAKLGLDPKRVVALLSSARRKLMAAQQHRSIPRDTKVLAGWNGLALRALSDAARLRGDKTYLRAAKRIRDYLVGELWDGKQLWRARNGDQPLGVASLQDYAYVASGLLAWTRASGEKGDLALVHTLVEQGWQRFHDADGWRLDRDRSIAYGGAEPVIADGPMPSPSAVLVRVSLQVARQSGDQALLKRALSALNVGRTDIESDAFWYASQIEAVAIAQAKDRGTDNVNTDATAD